MVREPGTAPRVLHTTEREPHAHPSAQALDLTAPRRVHIVGIGGAGMSAIAEVLARMGHHVSGSDLRASSTLTRLELHGVTTAVGHDAANVPDAAALALELGAPFDAVTRALGTFGGVARRFQFRGEASGVTLIDDYAHLPSEVRAALRAAREGGWGRVVAVFQPHRYTRTGSLWRDFADAFVDADALVLTDIYAAGESPRPGVSGRLVLRAVLDAHPDAAVAYLPRRADVVRHALGFARPGDVLLTLGAGDLTTVPDEWLAFDARGSGRGTGRAAVSGAPS